MKPIYKSREIILENQAENDTAWQLWRETHDVDINYWDKPPEVGYKLLGPHPSEWLISTLRQLRDGELKIDDQGIVSNGLEMLEDYESKLHDMRVIL